MKVAIDWQLFPVKLFYFFFYGGNSCISPYLPHYLQQHKGFSPVDVTTILGTVPFLVILTKPLLGHLADKSGRYRTTLFGTLLIGTVFLTLIAMIPPITQNSAETQLSEQINLSSNLNLGNESLDASSPEGPENHFWTSQFWMVFLCVVMGNAFGLKTAYTIMDAVTLNILSVKNKIKDYGKQRMWMSAGLAVALLSVSLVMDRISGAAKLTDYTPAFVGFILCITLSAVCVAFLQPTICEQSAADTSSQGSGLLVQNQKETGGLKNVLPKFLEADKLWFLSMGFVLGINFGQSVWLSPFYLKVDLSASQTAIGCAVVFVCLSTMAFFIVSGRLIAKLGHDVLLGLCLWAYAIRALCWTFLANPWYSLPVELLFGLSIGLWLSTMGSYASKMASEGSRASAQAILSAVYDGIGVGLGNLISGRLYQNFGGSATWFLFGTATSIAALTHSLILITRWTISNWEYRPGSIVPSKEQKMKKKNKNGPNPVIRSVGHPQIVELEKLQKETSIV